MCQLCSSDEKERQAERDRLYAQAERLQLLAAKIQHMASGNLKPHTTQAGHVTSIAHSVIRSLVEDYV